MISLPGQGQCCYLHPLDGDAVEELRGLVKGAGGLCEAARRLNVSKGQLSNVLAGRRRLFAPLLLRARSIGGPVWGRGYVRLLSGEQYRRLYGHEYPYGADDEEDW